MYASWFDPERQREIVWMRLKRAEKDRPADVKYAKPLKEDATRHGHAKTSELLKGHATETVLGPWKGREKMLGLWRGHEKQMLGPLKEREKMLGPLKGHEKLQNAKKTGERKVH